MDQSDTSDDDHFPDAVSFSPLSRTDVAQHVPALFAVSDHRFRVNGLLCVAALS